MVQQQRGAAAVRKEVRSENPRHQLRTGSGHSVVVPVATFLEGNLPRQQAGGGEARIFGVQGWLQEVGNANWELSRVKASPATAPDAPESLCACALLLPFWLVFLRRRAGVLLVVSGLREKGFETKKAPREGTSGSLRSV